MITLLILLAILAIDIFLNWYLIEKKKIRPNHTINWSIRAVLGGLLAKFGPSTPDVHWLLKGLSYIPIYSFLFNLGLNLARKKYIDYLGNAKTDQLELKILPEWSIFVFTGIIAIFCILLVVFNYDPYAW